MDPSVSPRTNFYLFAVGQWLKDNPVPPNETVMTSAVEMDRVNSYKLHVLLEEAAAGHARKGRLASRWPTSTFLPWTATGGIVWVANPSLRTWRGSRA